MEPSLSARTSETLVGAGIAYEAYQISLEGATAPVLEGLSGAQRFFIGYAQTWNSKVRPEELKRRIATDPHSPDEFRCNQILKNIGAFATAFDLAPGDALYLSEDERISIW